MEEARSGQPNALVPAAHVQLHQLAQDQLAEATRGTMARQVFRLAQDQHAAAPVYWPYSAAAAQPPSSSVSPLVARSTMVPGPRRTVVPLPRGGPRSSVAALCCWVLCRHTLPAGG